MRKPLAFYREAARDLCRLRGYDPDKIVHFNERDQGSNLRPLWMNYADQLRAHDERTRVLKDNDDC